MAPNATRSHKRGSKTTKHNSQPRSHVGSRLSVSKLDSSEHFEGKLQPEIKSREVVVTATSHSGESRDILRKSYKGDNTKVLLKVFRDVKSLTTYSGETVTVTFVATGEELNLADVAPSWGRKAFRDTQGKGYHDYSHGRKRATWKKQSRRGGLDATSATPAREVLVRSNTRGVAPRSIGGRGNNSLRNR